MDDSTTIMDSPAADDGAIDLDTAEHSIPNRINTSNLTGWKYYAATVANHMVVADNALKNSTTTSKTVLNSISHAIKPFK